MSFVCRVGDKTSGSWRHGPRIIVAGAHNVYVNGHRCATVGSTVVYPFGKVVTGKNSVIVNGRPIAVVGSKTEGWVEIVVTGSKDVLA